MKTDTKIENAKLCLSWSARSTKYTQTDIHILIANKREKRKQANRITLFARWFVYSFICFLWNYKIPAMMKRKMIEILLLLLLLVVFCCCCCSGSFTEISLRQSTVCCFLFCLFPLFFVVIKLQNIVQLVSVRGAWGKRENTKSKASRPKFSIQLISNRMFVRTTVTVSSVCYTTTQKQVVVLIHNKTDGYGSVWFRNRINWNGEWDGKGSIDVYPLVYPRFTLLYERNLFWFCIDGALIECKS